MLNKILVAIDESGSSEWAFDTALAMAKSLNAELLLAHILDASAYDSPKSSMFLVGSLAQDTDSPEQEGYDQEWQQFKDRYDTLLKQKGMEAEAAGVTATHVQAYGTPDRKLCEIARTNNIDLIVVGNRDRTNKSSISSYLVHHAPCSVTVVHPKASYQSATQTDLREAVAV